MMEKNKTESDKIWEEIKSMQLPIFGLLNQHIEDHLTRMVVAPDRVHGKMKSSAVIVALEERLGAAFVVEPAGNDWVMISRTQVKPNLDAVLKQVEADKK